MISPGVFFDNSELEKVGWVNQSSEQTLNERYKIITKDIKNFLQLETCLNFYDHLSIINSRELFWSAYCTSLYPNQTNKKSAPLSVSIKDNKMTYSGREDVVKKIKTFIEEIRCFFQSGYDVKKNFDLLLVEVNNSIFLKNDAPLIDYTCMRDGLFDSHFHSVIKPAFADLANYCGIDCSSVKEKRLVKKYAMRLPILQEVDVLRFEWKKDSHLIYQVAPITLQNNQQSLENVYGQYKVGLFCDFKLIANEDEIHVHTNILYANGGPVIQAILTGDNKEAKQKEIQFTTFSLPVIKIFVDYIYLGAEAIFEQLIHQGEAKELDLFQLFELSSCYQLHGLTDCCTNLISIFATKDNLRDLERVLGFYSNEHLTRLYNHLRDSSVVT